MTTVVRFIPVTMGLSLYAAHVHELNRIWWYDEEGNLLKRDPAEMNMLAVSEIAEAMEGVRKDLQDDHLPQYKMFFVELADCVIRVLDYAGAKSLDLSKPPRYSKLVNDPTTTAGHLLNIVASIIQLQRALDLTPKAEGHCAADIISSCVELAQAHGCTEFWTIVYDKLVYNQKRADHTYAARKAVGGKKF